MCLHLCKSGFIFSFLALLLSLQTGTEVSAETMYVEPLQELAVRRGQGTEYKILAMVKSGDALEVVKQSDGYAKVRLGNGKEGWIPQRFLNAQLPAKQMLKKVEQANAQLKEQANLAAKKAVEATTALEETKSQLNDALLERNKILESYQKLQKDTADVMQLKKDQEETAQINAELSRQMISVKDENAVLKKEKNLDWFITGAAVLLVGFLLGKIPFSRRKKRGYIFE